MANLLRHHPDRYALNQPYILSKEYLGTDQEWKSSRNKTVKGKTSSALRRSDIHEHAAFIFVSDPADCEEYLNAAWNSRRD